MKICIKEKDFNPSLLAQKWCNEKIATEMGYAIVEIEEKYNDCCFEDFNEDLTFSIDKYNARKQKENEAKYEDLIISKIRKKYSVNQEFAIQRKRYTEPEKFDEYYDYVEQCMQEAKNAINQEQITESISEEREDGN